VGPKIAILSPGSTPMLMRPLAAARTSSRNCPAVTSDQPSPVGLATRGRFGSAATMARKTSVVDETVSTSYPTTGVVDCGIVVGLMALLRGRKLLPGYLNVRRGRSEIDHVCRDNPALGLL